MGGSGGGGDNGGGGGRYGGKKEGVVVGGGVPVIGRGDRAGREAGSWGRNPHGKCPISNREEGREKSRTPKHLLSCKSRHLFFPEI